MPSLCHLSNGQPLWEPGKMKEYKQKAPRRVASTIFQARTRMLKVKSNYKNKYKTNLTCRACGLAEETQIHIMQECTKLHQNDTNKVTQEMIFSENTTQLSQTAQRIQTTMNLLETFSKPSGVPLQSDRRALTPSVTGGMALPEAQRSPGTTQQPGTSAP